MACEERRVLVEIRAGEKKWRWIWKRVRLEASRGVVSF